MVTHSGRLLTNAIIENLQAEGLTVGDGERPATGAGWTGAAGQSDYQGYLVVHPLSGGRTDGPIGALDEDAFPLYQLTAWGATRAQCENIADLSRSVMLEVPIVVEGRYVAHVRIDMLGGARRNDQVQPPEWQGVERYRVTTTPV